MLELRVINIAEFYHSISMLQASDRVSFLPSVLKVTIVKFVIESGVDLGEVATFLKSSKIILKPLI